MHYRDGTTGFITADLGYGKAVEKHLLAFQSRFDAEEMQYLFQANMGEDTTMVRIVPMKPNQLLDTASENDLAVTVYGRGQLKLKPGMTVEQIGEAAALCR